MSNNGVHHLPQLQTTRLVLKALEQEDANSVFRLRSDETVNLMVHRVAPATVDDAMAFINSITKKIAEENAFYWGIFKDEILTGTIGLFNLQPEFKRAEVGFELFPEYRGKGIMQESLEAVRDFAFGNLALDALIAVVNPENAPSINLILRNGFIAKNDLEIDVFPGDVVHILTR